MIARPLKLIRSSAGSGKTYRLVIEFLRLAFSNPSRYREVLVITFTRAATAEIRERILAALHSLSTDPWNPMPISEALQAGGHTPEEIQTRAKNLLEAILTDFDYFNVSTIDSFLNSIAMAGGKELGLPPGFRVVINENELNETLLGRYEEKLHDSPDLKAFLFQLLCRGDRAQTLESVFGNAAQYIERSSENSKVTCTEMLRHMNGLEAFFLEAWNIHYAEFQDVLARHGFTEEHFHNKSRGFAANMAKVDANCTDRTYDRVLSHSTQFNGGNRLLADRNRTLGDLEDAAQTLHNLICNSKHSLALKSVLAGAEPDLQISHYARLIRQKHLTRNSILTLRDLTTLLSDKASVGELQSLFMLSGRSYKHVLIDEFQDTSLKQFSVLRELLSESLGSGFESVIVGDPKQMIYRFRGASSTLLREVSDQFGGFLQTEYIRNNYRSAPQIVAFNNALLPKIVGVDYVEAEGLDTQPLSPTLVGLTYADLIQETPSAVSRNGKVTAHWIEAEKYTVGVLQPRIMQDLIETIASSGNSLNGVAVLAPKNDTLIEVAYWLGEAGIPYTMEDGIPLSTSPMVRLIHRSLALVCNADSHFIKTEIEFLHRRYIKGDPDLKFNSGSVSESIAAQAHGWKYLKPVDAALKIVSLWNLDLFGDALAGQYIDALIEWQGSSGGSIKKWIDTADLGIMRSVSGGKTDAVRLSTIHKAKGLQWDTVHLLWLGAGRKNEEWATIQLPNFEPLTIKVKADFEHPSVSPDSEERLTASRLDDLNQLYVGLTRAESNLHLYVPKKTDGTRLEAKLGAALKEIADRGLYEEVEYTLAQGSNFVPEPLGLDDDDSPNSHRRPLSQR